MSMPLMISSTSSNNNYRSRGLSAFPSFINGGGADQPNFNGGNHQQVINGVSVNHSNHTNRSLSNFPSFNGGEYGNQQIINGVSMNHSNHTNRRLSNFHSFHGGESGNQQAINVNYSNGTYRGLTLVPTFNDHELVMNNGIISSNYSYDNQQEIGFSVPSSNNYHGNNSPSLVQRFNFSEPLMNTGISPSYSFSSINHIVSNFNNLHETAMNHQNSSLSHVPSFNMMGGRGISYMRNHHFSYSSRLMATRKIVRSGLVTSFFAARRRMVINQEEAIYTTSRPTFNNPQVNVNNRTRLTITELDEDAPPDENQTTGNNNGTFALAHDPIPVSVYHTSNENDVDIEEDYGDGDGDGKIHSLPYKKYGPYTCPRCFGKFETSQKFAAHVSCHYKAETTAQKRRRLMGKIRRRNLQLQQSREGITLLPTQPVAQNEAANMGEAETEGEGGSGNGDGALFVVPIKEEPADFNA